MPPATKTPEGFASLWYLRQLELMLGMSQQAAQRFNASLRTTKRRRGEWIYMLGEPSDNIYFIQEGRMKISALSEDGHEVLLDIIGPGEIFGDVGALQGTPRTTSAQALDDSILCEMHRKDFETLLETHPEIALHLLKSLASRLKKAEAQLLNLVCKDVSTRVREALIELIGVAPKPPVRIGITQQDLANLIGASRQKTWASLKELEDAGILKLRYRSILVTAPHKLREGLVLGKYPEPASGRWDH